MELNQRAAMLVERLLADSASLKIAARADRSGCRLIDCGIAVEGGYEAGRRLAEICLAGLGDVQFAAADAEYGVERAIDVSVDDPLAACMASQYAGWQISEGEYFAMGSGPMRAAAGKEALFEAIGHREQPKCAVGVLEARAFPPSEVCLQLAQQCGVAPARLTLLAAPTASRAGTVQVVARSVETALHKLHELGFDLTRIARGLGSAPLPPVAADDLAAIGLTNDAILYGGDVTLWVRGDDASIRHVGPRVPSSASGDYGQPFAEIFKRYDRDFYAIDPHLFSPARVTFECLDSGQRYSFGALAPAIVRQSFSLA